MNLHPKTSKRLAIACLAITLSIVGIPVQAGQAGGGKPFLQGIHGFDFEFGHWRVDNRVKRPDGTWVEFKGTADVRPLMDGSADVEEHTFFKSTGKTYGVGIRAYDRKTGTWAIWWIDSRAPHLPMDPPNVGRFENGVGTFYSDSTVGGKKVRTRYIWSHITQNGARWEQATSTDAGITWDTNWIMELHRAS